MSSSQIFIHAYILHVYQWRVDDDEIGLIKYVRYHIYYLGKYLAIFDKYFVHKKLFYL